MAGKGEDRKKRDAGGLGSEKDKGDKDSSRLVRSDRETWSDWKSNVRSKAASLKRQTKTGDLPVDMQQLSPLEERLLFLLGQVVVEGGAADDEGSEVIEIEISTNPHSILPPLSSIQDDNLVSDTSAQELDTNTEKQKCIEKPSGRVTIEQKIEALKRANSVNERITETELQRTITHSSSEKPQINHNNLDDSGVSETISNYKRQVTEAPSLYISTTSSSKKRRYDEEEGTFSDVRRTMTENEAFCYSIAKSMDRLKPLTATRFKAAILEQLVKFEEDGGTT